MEETISNLGQDALAKLELMAVKLGTTVEHLFTTVTQEMFYRHLVGGIGCGIGTIFCLILMGFGVRAISRALAIDNNNRGNWPSNKIALFWPGLAVSILCIFTIMGFGGATISHAMASVSPTAEAMNVFTDLLRK